MNIPNQLTCARLVLTAIAPQQTAQCLTRNGDARPQGQIGDEAAGLARCQADLAPGNADLHRTQKGQQECRVRRAQMSILHFFHVRSNAALTPGS